MIFCKTNYAMFHYGKTEEFFVNLALEMLLYLQEVQGGSSEPNERRTQ